MQIDHLEPVDIGSAEGVTTDHAARGRIHYLVGQHMAIVTQTQTADAKAAALLAVVGIAASRGIAFPTGGGLPMVIALLVLLLSLAVAGACLAALMPRYAQAEMRAQIRLRDRFSWPAIAGPAYSPDEYAAFMRTADVSQLTVSLAHSNALVSRILLSKFRLLRIAFVLAMADAAVLGLGMAIWPD